MADDQERLVVAIEARIRDFEKNMAKASRTAGDEFTKIERRAKQSGDRLEGTMKQAAARVGGVLKNFAAGFVGGIAAGGVIGIVGQLGQVAAGIAEIGDQAKRAGVTTEVFQEWATVATQARIPVDALTDGLKELQLRGDEFAVTGKGSAAEAFGRLGYGAEELKRKLADPSALLLEIIERLGKFDRAAQIRIADEVFGGTAGERFVELLDRGAVSIRATIREAHQLGNILDSDVIERAAEVDRRFKIVSQTVGTALKGAIIDAIGALQEFIDRFNAFEARRDATLEEDAARLGRERLDIERQILELRERQQSGKGVGDGILGTSIGESTFGEAEYELQRRMEALGAEEKMITDVLEARRKLRETPSGSPASTFTPPAYIPPPATGGGAKRDASAAAAEREAKAVRALIAELERELSLIGATDLERRISNELRSAGAAATDDQRARIVALISAIEAETLAQERGTQAKEEFANVATGAITGFINDLRNGATVGQAFASTLNRIIDRLVDMAVQLLVIGPLLKMFGFSGGGIVPGAGKVQKLATGGYVSGPGSATSDTIPARLSNGEFVVNAAATAKHRALLEAVNDNRLPALTTGGMAGQGIAAPAAIGGQVISINAPITVNGSAGTPEQNTDLAKRMAREMEATMRHVVFDEMRKATRPGNFFSR
ncbi:MAG: hypothetical protein M9939_20565 [Mesorhizobium sp.]|nr:hypothetical protein [Mesorhizobium sp.]MCO5163531.1 hypothetical protein [Mesorhizobium sp.]